MLIYFYKQSIDLFPGIFKHIQSLNRTIIADHISIEDQTAILGRLNAIAGISFTIGPAIGGHFAELENGFSYICSFTSAIFILNIGNIHKSKE